MQETTLYQNNRQQLLMMAAAIFGSIVAAVIVSTVIIMSLMRGEIANAVASNVQNAAPVSQAITPASCAATPADTEESTPSAETTSVAPVSDVPPTMDTWQAGSTVAKHSFNNTTINNTTNNVNNTEIHKIKNVTIKDSFNDNSINSHNKIEDSFNPVIIKDNDVKINSDNKTIDVTHVDIDKTYNWNSNNVTVASNNTENHLLSDNTTIVAPLVVPFIQ